MHARDYYRLFGLGRQPWRLRRLRLLAALGGPEIGSAMQGFSPPPQVSEVLETYLDFSSSINSRAASRSVAYGVQQLFGLKGMLLFAPMKKKLLGSNAAALL